MKTNCTSQSISDFYGKMETRSDMSFQNLTQGETSEMTHCYHPYTAKFIPQLVKKLLLEFTEEDDYIWDPFCGSGTLNVEAFRANRNSLGSDINPVAILISRSKTTPLVPEELHRYKEVLFDLLEHRRIRDVKYYISRCILNGNQAELDRWFPRENLTELAELLRIIKTSTPDSKFQSFALCCYSSVLKRCSNWLHSSIKPQIDPSRVPAEPAISFMRQFSKMEKANERFHQETLGIECRVNLLKHNAKSNLPRFYERKFDAIITSPPYLVSYEYSDLFRLSSYLLYYREDYDRFKSGFIGTRRRKRVRRKSTDKRISAGEFLRDMHDTLDGRLLHSIKNYYAEMTRFIHNARNHLRVGGKLVMIVGDARTRSRHIPNAYILFEIAKECGLHLSKQFKREISGKSLPTYRDKETGKFTSTSNPNKVEIHAEEYILVFKEGQSGSKEGDIKPKALRASYPHDWRPTNTK